MSRAEKPNHTWESVCYTAIRENLNRRRNLLKKPFTKPKKCMIPGFQLTSASLGIAYFYSGDLNAPDKVFSDCRNMFKEISDAYGYTLCSMWLALIAYENGEEERCLQETTIFLQEIHLGN